MKSAAIFTSTISFEILNWLKSYAHQKKMTQRKVLEEALNAYRHEMKRKNMAASFKKAAKDREIIDLAEEGLGDYLDQLKSF